MYHILYLIPDLRILWIAGDATKVQRLPRIVQLTARLDSWEHAIDARSQFPQHAHRGQEVGPGVEPIPDGWGAATP